MVVIAHPINGIVMLIAAFFFAWQEFIYYGKISGKEARAEGVVEISETLSNAFFEREECRMLILFRDGGTSWRVESFRKLGRGRSRTRDAPWSCSDLTGEMVALAYNRARPEEAVVIQEALERKFRIVLTLVLAVGGLFLLLRRC